ncbi:nucleotide exchange factor GrpE [Pseudogracilibacillus auburnensis]|uniref:Protein GrpE n=1 Tax=Pseudogracilibacillus auburnensis TaxID=1494959 RepID=A0A2V3VX80_9BACI|nr:nucleotide exchange factor GrpE [Pseudogracilibacillus auburnensis]MBO1003470.1 nucleotide exchange factor GrpE [Pseudogracilibacillus auburnensis]PXW86542.1 molecular chaperone GrpE [Pseudogracilibacillus auburnensis]
MEEQEKDTIVTDIDEEPISVEETQVDDESAISNEENEHTNEVQLQKEMDTLTEEKEQLQDRLLRVQAEFENFKRRTEKEKIAERKYKSQDLANELLPVMDNFERALQSEISDENQGFMEGIQMVYNQLEEALKSQGVEKIETENKEFDPNIHHAVMQIEDEAFESNIVVEELQKGYMLKDKVIRPAMVKVNK